MKPNASVSVCASALVHGPGRLGRPAAAPASRRWLPRPPSRPTGPGRRSGSCRRCLMSSCPAALARMLDHEVAQEPGGRPERLARTGPGSPQQVPESAARPHRPPAVPPPDVHTGRLSASTDTRISAFSLGRVPRKGSARHAARRPATGRRSGWPRWAPVLVGGHPAGPAGPRPTAWVTPPEVAGYLGTPSFAGPLPGQRACPRRRTAPPPAAPGCPARTR